MPVWIFRLIYSLTKIRQKITRQVKPKACHLFCGNVESENYRTFWVGKDLKDQLVPTPAMGRDTFH